MFKEGLQELAKQAVSAAAAQELGFELNDNKVYVYKHLDGTVESFAIQPEPRSHHVTTLASFAAAVGEYAELGGAAIWVSAEKIVGILDDGGEFHRQNTITMPLNVSPLFATLARIHTVLKQKPLLNLLRHDLKPAEITPDSLEIALANLTWETHSTTEGDFGAVKSSMGRAIASEVRGTRDIPLEVTFEFHGFPSLSKEFECQVSLDCSITIDPAEEEIRIKPFPGELEAANCAAVEMLRAKVAEMTSKFDVNVFAGTP